MALRDRDLVPNKKKKPWNRLIIVIFLSISVAFFIRLIIHQFFFLPVVVNESAMEPELKLGSVVTAERRFSAKDIKLNQIVWISHPLNNQHRMFRKIKALPKDKIEINQSNVLINGIVISSQNRTDQNSLFDQKQFTLSDNQYFVVADNNGLDSRHFGPISIQQILGLISN
ncbi:MAG: signal peptidase I [Leptonema sp. (in: Bacteria)]|nr:signal peptidase I [Leptonema sp. (in: bacteria)]